MLLLVVSYGNDIRIIEQNIRSHEYRICEESGSYGFLTLRLGLELSHAVEFSGVGCAVQDPSEFCVA